MGYLRNKRMFAFFILLGCSTLSFAQPDDAMQASLRLPKYADRYYQQPTSPKMSPQPNKGLWHGPFASTNVGHSYIFQGPIPVLEAEVVEVNLGYHFGERIKVAGTCQYYCGFNSLIHRFQTRYTEGNEFRLNSPAIETFAAKLYLTSKPIGSSLFQFNSYLALGTGYSIGEIRAPMNLVDMGVALGGSMLSGTAGIRYNMLGYRNPLYFFTSYVGIQLAF